MQIRTALLVIVALYSLRQANAQTSYTVDFGALNTLSDGLHELDFGDFKLTFRGYLDSSGPIDVDVKKLGVNTVMTTAPPTNPSTTAFGVGEISINGGLMTGIKFAYGNRGDQHFYPDIGIMGGFTALARNHTFGFQSYDDGVELPEGVSSNTSIGSLQPPLGVTPRTEGGLFRQFNVGLDQPAGPVRLEPKFYWDEDGAKGSSTLKSPAFDSFRWTNGTQFGLPDEPTRPGHAQLANVTVEVATAKDLLKNSVMQVLPPHPTRMELIFSPHVGDALLTLAEAAKVLDVDHFNWVQNVTHIPRNWTARVISSTDGFTTRSVIETKSGNFTDLVLQTNSHEEFAYSFVTDVVDERGIPFEYPWRQDFADGEIPYLNEKNPEHYKMAMPGETKEAWHITTHTGEHKLSFRDLPWQPIEMLDLNDPQDYFGFETQLVGIRPDGSIRWLVEEFPGLGLLWNWKSNAIGEGGIRGGVFDTSPAGGFLTEGDGEIVGGGVFDIRSDFVPEATSLVLALVAAVVTCASIRRSRDPRGCWNTTTSLVAHY